MNFEIKKFAVGALTAALAAHMGVRPANAANPDEFGNGLSKAYEALSGVERDQGDRRSAEYYAARAQAARSGQIVEPEPLAGRVPFLRDTYRDALADARARLVTALDEGARAKAPAPAARAQSAYDCWLEQATEDLQPDHVDACKRTYLAAMEDVDRALLPPPAPPPAPEPDTDSDGVLDRDDACPDTSAGTPVDERGCPRIPDLAGVHFAHNRSELTNEAEAVLREGIEIVRNNPHVTVDIVGHTDSSGPDEYNQKLSLQRATRVEEYLVAHGIDADRLRASGQGESAPVADNATREGRARNRRVTLTASPR